METVIIGLMLGVASGLAKDGGVALVRGAFALPTNVLQLAIRATSMRFQDVEGTEPALRDWTSGRAFTNFLERVYSGERVIDEDIVASFIDDGNFYLLPDEECISVAGQIVLDFLEELSDGLYRSSDGLPVLARRQEMLHQQTKREIISSHEATYADIKADLASLHSLIADTSNQSGQAEQEAAREAENSELTENIDFARKLMERGLIHAAKTELERLRSQNETMSEELRFRILTNLAGCELADENSASARALLEEAHSLQPENQKGIANAALAAQLGSDSERAVELAHKARASNSRDSQATAVLITQLWETGDSIELETLVSKEGWVATDRQCVLALAGVRIQQLRFEEAESLCQLLIEQDPNDAVGFLTLSQCMLSCVHTNRFSGGYTTDWIAKLRKAEDAATRALEILNGTELRAQRRGSLMARATARMLFGMDIEAMSDLDEILREEPENSDATIHKGLLQLYRGRFAEAAALLESGHNSDEDEKTALPLAEALLALGDSEGAAKLVKNTLKLDNAEWDDVLRGEVLVRAELGCDCEDSVGPILSCAMGSFPENTRLLTLYALHSSIYGAADEAERAFTLALDSAEDEDRREVLLRFGSFYEGLERFSEAADLYAEAVSGEPVHPAAMPLLVCLVRSNRFREALSWVLRIRQDSSHLPRIAVDAETMILEHVGDVHAALILHEEICRRSDATDFDLLNLAVTQFRCSDRDAARSTVSSVRAASLAQDPRSILKLAQLKFLLDVPGHFADAFLARRLGTNDPTVHLGYFTMFTARGKEWVESNVIGLGCATLLRSGPVEQWWQILDAGEDSLGHYELMASSDLAQALLGRSVGETIKIRQDIEELSYDIVSVQSKYLRAYQETYEEFSTRFPGNKSLSRVSVEGEDFTKVFETVDARHNFVSEAERIYREGRLPFASFASLVGLSVPELWFACAQSNIAPLRFSTGTDEDDIYSDALLAKTDGIVLDLTALLTVKRLNLAEGLRNRYSKVAVPQGVIDELQRAYALRSMGPSPTSSLGRGAYGGYALSEVSTEGEAAQLEFLRSALEFAEAFDRIPSYALLEVDNADELVDALTASAVAAVYADDQNSTAVRVLVSDDIVLSAYARSISVGAVNSQDILRELLRSGMITGEDYSTAIEGLSLLRYSFVRVSLDDLIRRFEATGWVSSDGTRAMLNTLRGPECSEESAVSVAANLIARAAGRASSVQTELILWLVLSALKQGRSQNSVLRKFKSGIASILTLAPQLRDQILEIVNLGTAVSASK